MADLILPPAPFRQVFYHLGELDDALTYALGADTLFDINEKSEYVQTLLGERLPTMEGMAVGAGRRGCNAGGWRGLYQRAWDGQGVCSQYQQLYSG